jgi:peptide deformylase
MRKTTGRARPITMYGEAVLHRKCQPVQTFDKALQDLIQDMFASMYEAEGVGLAANQIGVDASIFVYDCPDASGENQIGHLVNPVLATPAFAVSAVVDIEGCLSVPGQRAQLSRSGLATATGQDMFGNPLTISGTGRLARCLQHETDHLNGTLYVDLLPEKQRATMLAEAGLPK